MMTNPEMLAVMDEMFISIHKSIEAFDRINGEMTEIDSGLAECVYLLESKIAARRDAPSQLGGTGVPKIVVLALNRLTSSLDNQRLNLAVFLQY